MSAFVLRYMLATNNMILLTFNAGLLHHGCQALLFSQKNAQIFRGFLTRGVGFIGR